MIVDCVSDLHGFYPKLEGGDLLIIAGDMTPADTVPQWNDFYTWLRDQNYRKKIYVAGNHDNLLQSAISFEDPQNRWMKECSEFQIEIDDPVYLCDSGTEFEGLKIWGSPWTKTFPGMNPVCKAFTVDMYQSLKDKWDLIPDDVDVLITHSPPYGILDSIARDFDARAGDVDLRYALESRIKPKLHIFGHIHENGGKQIVFKRPGYGTENNTICVNASYVNERYQPVNKPVRIIL